ncbi:MAG: S41 family peptidase [Gemmatimonadaceae bacterium]
MRSRGSRSRRPALVLALLLCNVGVASPQNDPGRAVRPRTAAEDLLMFSQVLNQIRTNHPDSLDTHELLMAAIQGIVHAADPHSFVIPATRLSPGKEELWRQGKLYPVPLEFGFVGGSPVVAAVSAGSEAAQQDILPGDELVSIDGQPVRAESEGELVFTLSGDKKSAVSLGFERRRMDGTISRFVREVRRERAGETAAIPVREMLDGSTGYVRITTFMAEKIAEQLHTALSDLEGRGMQRLVLDLRDNGGGSVREAAQVVGEFLPTGAIVYTAEGRKAELIDTGRVKRSFWRSEKTYPMVVMVNGGTASASELVAGALQDHDRALIVGRPSFGKSLMMLGLPLADGSLIELVVGHIRTPCGRVVQRQYRTITRRDYYRMARAERDTAGRPTCRTDGGRVVYGGGGIYPDVLLPDDEPVPLWVSMAREQSLTLSWVGGYVSAHAASLTSAADFAAATELPPDALVDFRRFASQQGVVIPDGPVADGQLQRLLRRSIAHAKWGDLGLYLTELRRDPAIAAAAALFDRAQALRGPR